MKYLENIALENLSKEISACELGGSLLLRGRVEIYSTKKTSDDKKHSKLLLSKHSGDGSPGGGCSEDTILLKNLMDLIQTLNAAQLDHDFSQLTTASFTRLKVQEAIYQINSKLSEVTLQNPMFLSTLWKEFDGALDNHVYDCDVFALTDPNYVNNVDDGVHWSFHYFFHAKDVKRIGYLNCHAVYKHRCFSDIADMDVEDEDEDWDNYDSRSNSEDGSEMEGDSEDD
jgi:hypothetical protein